jgi:RNA polymerase sigma factor (sigma-70 family)
MRLSFFAVLLHLSRTKARAPFRPDLPFIAPVRRVTMLVIHLDKSAYHRYFVVSECRNALFCTGSDSNMPMLSEEALIEGCKRRDTSCCEVLYRRYASRLMSIALRYANTTFEAEDILQEAFIRIFQSLHSYRHQGSFEGWLKRIVVHTAINHYHKHKKHFVLAKSEEENDYDGEAYEEDVVDRLSADELLRVIQSLPEGYRLVFNLYEIEEYTHQEIATLLGIQEGTSKSQLAKAKRFLRKRLESLHYSTEGWRSA